MTLIAEEAKTVENKTARLRALRLEREAAGAVETPKHARKTAKRVVRR